jgi:hypothetical protein
MSETNDKSLLALALVGLLILILLSFAIYKGITYVAEKAKDNAKDTELSNSLTIRAKYDNGYVYDLKYKLLDGRNIVSESKLLDGMIEVIDNLENKSYTVQISDERYYDMEKECHPDNIICEVNLEKYPEIVTNIIKFDEDYYRVLLYFKEGTFKQPIMCVSENSEKIKDIKLMVYMYDFSENVELMKIKKPKRLSLYVDTCYYIYSEKFIVDELRRNETLTYEGDIKKYNKQYGVKYQGFHNITYTPTYLNNYPIEDFQEGVHDYEIMLEFWDDKEFKKDDFFRFYLIDQHKLTNELDVGIKDIMKEYKILEED